MPVRSHGPKVANMLAIILFILFLIVAIGIVTGKIAWFDQGIIDAVQGLETNALTKVMKFFTWIGSTSVVIALTIILIFVLYFGLKHRRELLLFVVVAGGSEIINALLKSVFKRARPDFHRLIDISGYSFPSGHSMAAFSLYGALTFLLWRHLPTVIGRTLLIAVCLFMTLMIGISRIYLGVHYPSDVLGGYLASAVWLLLCISYFQKYRSRKLA